MTRLLCIGWGGKHIGYWCRRKDRRSPVLWEELWWQIGHRSCRPQSRLQGCFIIPLQMRIIIKLQVCKHFHQWQWWWGQCIIKVHHPNGAITKCPIAPPANASSASDISAYTKIHHYSSSRTVPSRSMFAFGCLDFLWVILETLIAQPNRACARHFLPDGPVTLEAVGG